MDPPTIQTHWHADLRRNVLVNTLRLIRILLISILEVASEAPKQYIPYHTSALSGYQWTLELLSGHPNRIQCELGVNKETFLQLILELRAMGFTNARSVTLEEQLAIFLYTCVTGLTTRHVGERFQRSNDTICRYVVLDI